MELKDPRPYVFWAHIQWLDESEAKPHLVIQNGPKTIFPPALQAHSTVTFNVSAESVRGLQIDEDGLSFSARFSGKEYKVYAPLDCLMMLHSGDNQVRIGLQKEAASAPVFQQETIEQEVPVQQKPELTVLKGVSDGVSDGIRRGKLTLVPKSPPPPEEPECA